MIRRQQRMPQGRDSGALFFGRITRSERQVRAFPLTQAHALVRMLEVGIRQAYLALCDACFS